MLLNIIYYLQHVLGRKGSVTKEDLNMFLGELYHVDREMFSNIIKPWKSLDDTLEELLEQGLIVQVSELVNEKRIRDEKDLRYWKGMRKTLDEVGEKLGGP